MLQATKLLPFFIEIASKFNKPAPTLSQIEIALANTDEAAAIQICRSKVIVKQWDGISNINTATPEYVRESNPWADIVYTISIDGEIIYLQTHDPFTEGWVAITEETFEEISSAHAEQIILEMAQNNLFVQVLNKLGLEEQTN